MNKYTKGEWKINPTGDINDLHIGCVCRFQTLGIADVETEYTGEEEALANAHLIAAAPDLLEACKGLYNQEDWANEDIDSNSPISKAKIAIAKAEPS